ncbi:hypothetical protein [Botrimarina hoheduenensis]|uniref:Uncharacterized protein n=1 Tax=Botrimarina hoheduenensis TaxID=2528000 RepID=A0A5C5WC83_9BACT|nr:hypothetical protein [Botrimarina hoheduenensis]TWT47699.1 hypothetical protein Pla111_13190 [Botrimarina hoheduenensis]
MLILVELRSFLAAMLVALAALVSVVPAGAEDVAAHGPVANPAATSLEIDVEHGEPMPVIDGVGWVLGIPKKLVLWDRRVDNHQISSETVDEAADFLANKEVDGVMIRVNQYDPFGEWKRLGENERVGLGWRATFGTVYTLGYSVLPGRLFGGDWYNPFTNTVHVYSDVPALALEQAAQAADTRERTHPGFYSAVRVLPFVGLVHETRSKQAVYNYVDETGTPAERAEARRVLQPQLGTEVGGQAAILVPQGDALLQLGGAAIGHAVGRYQAAQIIEEAQANPTTANGPTPAAPSAPVTTSVKEATYESGSRTVTAPEDAAFARYFDE